MAICGGSRWKRRSPRAGGDIAVMRDGETWRLPTKTLADKEQSFEEIYWWAAWPRRRDPASGHPQACRRAPY